MANRFIESRKDKWQQFDEVELWNICLRLSRELNILLDPYQPPQRLVIEKMIDEMALLKGARAMNHYNRGL